MALQTAEALFQRKSDHVVVLHVDDFGKWPEIEPFLRNLTDDLILTSNQPVPPSVSSSIPHGLSILTKKNGRDVAPFLLTLPILSQKGYRSFLKVHTLDYQFGVFCAWRPSLRDSAQWRKDQYSSLFSQRTRFEELSTLFPRLGLLAAEGHLISYLQFTEGNFASLSQLKQHFSLLHVPEDYLYPAGSMFYGRVNAFHDLTANPFPLERFEPSSQSSDPTWAHAFERVFGLLMSVRGYQALETSRVPLEVSTSSEEKLSVITRFHNPKSVEYLEDAGRSLRAQTSTTSIEWIVVTKNFSSEQIEKLRGRLHVFESETLKVLILGAQCQPGEDGRSKLLNVGIRASTGRFLSFLDYDDTVEPSYVENLTGLLRHHSAGLAATGCAQVLVNAVTRKEIRTLGYYCKGHRLSLFWNNFIPIHAFVIDRAKVSPSEILFDESLDRCEDYDLLIRLSSKYDLDLTLINVPLCKYHIRDDGSNTTLEGRQEIVVDDQVAWQVAVARMREKKSDLQITVSVREISDFVTLIKNVTGAQPVPMDPWPSLKALGREKLRDFPRLKALAVRLFRLTRSSRDALRAIGKIRQKSSAVTQRTDR